MTLSTGAPKPKPLLNPGAYAFLKDPPSLDKNERPFYFQKLLVTKQPKKPKEPKKEPEKPPAQPPPEPPKPPAPDKAKVLRMHYVDYKNIEYMGCLKAPGGTLEAMISVYDSRTKQTQELTVKQGDMLDELTVGVITSDMMMILDKKNEEQSILIYTSEKVVLE